MLDISSIAAGLESLRSAIDIVKYLRRANANVEQAEVKLKLAELMETLSELKVRLVDAKDENLALREQLSAANWRKDIRLQLVLRDNSYVSMDAEIPGYGQGPWCSSCFDSNGELISLHHKVASSASVGDKSWTSYKWECPVCKSAISNVPRPQN